MDWFLYDNGLRHERVNRDLADRFSVSEGLCSNNFHCWLRAMTHYLQSFVYIQHIENNWRNLTETFSQYQNLIRIIDYSEVLMETLKDFELESTT